VHAHSAIAEFQIGHVEGDKLGSPEGAGESEQQNCAITQALRVGVGQGGHGDHLVGCSGGLAHRGAAHHAANAVHGCLDHLAAGRRIVVAGELVGIADRGDATADGRWLDAPDGFRGEKCSDGLRGRWDGWNTSLVALT
jgi:hypothetical protein